MGARHSWLHSIRRHPRTIPIFNWFSEYSDTFVYVDHIIVSRHVHGAHEALNDHLAGRKLTFTHRSLQVFRTEATANGITLPPGKVRGLGPYTLTKHDRIDIQQ